MFGYGGLFGGGGIQRVRWREGGYYSAGNPGFLPQASHSLAQYNQTLGGFNRAVQGTAGTLGTLFNFFTIFDTTNHQYGYQNSMWATQHYNANTRALTAAANNNLAQAGFTAMFGGRTAGGAHGVGLPGSGQSQFSVGEMQSAQQAVQLINDMLPGLEAGVSLTGDSVARQLRDLANVGGDSGFTLNQATTLSVNGRSFQIPRGFYTPEQFAAAVIPHMQSPNQQTALDTLTAAFARTSAAAPAAGQAAGTGGGAGTPAPRRVRSQAIADVQKEIETLGLATDRGGADGVVDGIEGDITLQATARIEELLVRAGKLDASHVVDGRIAGDAKLKEALVQLKHDQTEYENFKKAAQIIANQGAQVNFETAMQDAGIPVQNVTVTRAPGFQYR